MEDSTTGHHEPEWEVSPWPLVVSVGALFMVPLAFSFYFVYDKPLMAILSLGIGVPLVIASVVGWTKGGIADIAHHGKEPGFATGAMPFFIVAEAFIFVSFFAAYWVLRLKAPNWPPAGTPEFGVTIPIIMTILLVSSSFTIHFSEHAIEHGDKGGFRNWLIVTIILGAIFFLLSAFEWSHLMHGGFTMKTNLFSTFFYSITGFHGSHVIVGLIIFLCILVSAFFGKVSKTFVKSASVYWHFVDLIWFFVVTQIYFW